MSVHIEYGENVPMTSIRHSKISDSTIEVGKPKRRETFVTEVMSEYDRFPGMIRENTVWDVYNNEARKVDNELVKDWQSSLNSLLVFAAIFAAVLTAFIIESKKMLEQDQTALLVDATVWNIYNIGNSSSLSYTPPNFEPTSAAISINCLLFASLGTSLAAALASVIALQWVADYDAAITRGGSSPEDRAKRRQFRFAGVEGWKMNEIIAALPLLLYSSVILFWAGAIQWMWTLHHIVGYVVAGGTAIAVFFYVTTTLLAALYVSAPFRTPFSRAIYWTLHAPIKSIGQVVLYLHTLLPVLTAMNDILWYIRRGCHAIMCSAPWWIRRAILSVMSPFQRLSNLIKSPTFLIQSIQWCKIHILPSMTSRLREDKAAKDDPTLEQQALTWLAYQLPLSADSHYRLGLLLAEVGNNLRYRSPTLGSSEDPWIPIIEYFSRDCLHRMISANNGDGRYEDVGVLLQFIKPLVTEGKIKPASDYEMDYAKQNYWTQCIVPPGTKDFSQSTAFLLSRDVPIPSVNSTEELAATASLIRWRNILQVHRRHLDWHCDVWMSIFANPKPYSQDYLDSCQQIFARCISYLGREDSLFHLSFSSEPEARRNQVVMMLKIAKSLVKEDNSENFHYSLIVTISRQMVPSNEEHPHSSAYQDTLIQQLATIQDPCLAIMVSYVCGVPIPADIVLTNSYKSRYLASLKWIQELLYHKISLDDSAVTWRSRAAVFGIGSKKEIQLCQDAPQDPIILSYLQHIVQYSTLCYGHSHGIHHVLFHLYQNTDDVFIYSDMNILGGLIVNTVLQNPVLVLLAGPDTNHSSNGLRRLNASAECAEVLKNICNTVKQQPASIYALLMDIATAESKNAWNAALILECVEKARALPEDDECTHILRPLAQAVKILGGRDYGCLARYGEVRSPPIDIVVEHAERISRLLLTTYTSKIVSSSSHLRMLLCARASTTAQPAIGKLPIYTDI